MNNNSFLLPDTLIIDNSITADSVLTEAIELTSKPVAIINEINNYGFILFLICFFFIVIIIGGGNKLLLSMFSGLYRNKERQSMFYETVTGETVSKIILSIQTVILITLILFCYAVHENYILISSLSQTFNNTGKIFLLLGLFFLYKYLAYSIAGAIYFKKEMVTQWNDDFLSLISLNGVFLFFPVLILFFVEAAYIICLFFIVLHLIFNVFFIFYKTYSLFFHKKQRYFYFILYLCAQEVLPLYLVYRGFIYLITQGDTIWIQA